MTKNCTDEKILSVIEGEHKVDKLDVREGVSGKRVREGVIMDKLYVGEHRMENSVDNDSRTGCNLEHGVSRKMGEQVQNMIMKLQSSPRSTYECQNKHYRSFLSPPRICFNNDNEKQSICNPRNTPASYLQGTLAAQQTPLSTQQASEVSHISSTVSQSSVENKSSTTTSIVSHKSSHCTATVTAIAQ